VTRSLPSTVRLKGLKTYRARERLYVYFRGSPELLVKGFVDTREELMATSEVVRSLRYRMKNEQAERAVS
jgi:hypothetical protein